MSEFEVYKDINLFLRKVIFQLWHHKKTDKIDKNTITSEEDQEALETLMSLMDDDDIAEQLDPLHEHIRRDAGIKIKSLKMPPLSKHKALKLFLDLVQEDLKNVNWGKKPLDNLNKEERLALSELENAQGLVIKSSDKGGNVVLLKEEFYENEVLR